MSSDSPSAAVLAEPHVAAGHLPPWTVGDLPAPPVRNLTSWLKLVGPGVLLAGA